MYLIGCVMSTDQGVTALSLLLVDWRHNMTYPAGSEQLEQVL